MNPFEFVKAINNKQNIIRDDLDEKSYDSFLVNKAFSYFPDTILLANEMNFYHHIDSKLKNDFFINTIRKNPKRFSKWNKKQVTDEFRVIKEYYGYDDDNTHFVLSLLTPQQIENISRKVDKGGRRAKK